MNRDAYQHALHAARREREAANRYRVLAGLHSESKFAKLAEQAEAASKHWHEKAGG